MDWHRPIWIMCERTAAGLWAEPANVLSGLGFVAVALAALEGWRRSERRDPALPLLVALVLVIATGSTLFHTFAVRWALYADLIPIQVFVGIYFLVAMRRFFGLALPAALGVTILYVVAARVYVGEVPWSFLRGYGRLLSGLGPLVAIALLMRLRGAADPALPGLVGAPARQVGDLLFAAAVVMGAAIACGASDRALCGPSAVGSHFLWHLLTACVIGLLLKAVLVAGTAREPAAVPALAPAPVRPR